MTRVCEYVILVAFWHVMNAEGDCDAPLSMEFLNLRRKLRIIDMKKTTGYYAIETLPKMKDRANHEQWEPFDVVVQGWPVDSTKYCFDRFQISLPVSCASRL